MKKVFLLLLVFALCLGLCACSGGEDDPENIVRNTCLDQYYDSNAAGYENFRGKNVGLIVKDFIENSYIYTSRDNMEKLWTEEWKVNGNIPWFDEITAVYNFNPKKEDLLCITLSEQFDYQSEENNTVSCVFTVDKKTKEVVPIMFFGTENGKITGELTVDSPQVTVSAFYIFIKYSTLDLEHLKEVVYGIYN